MNSKIEKRREKISERDRREIKRKGRDKYIKRNERNQNKEKKKKEREGKGREKSKRNEKRRDKKDKV